MKFQWLRPGTLLPVILAAGLALRLTAIVLFHPPLISDDIDYVALGKSLAHGDGYRSDGHPTAYRPPGYPFLLAVSFKVFGESLVPVRAAQVLADLLSCFLVYALGRRLFSERVGLISAGIFVLFPVEILYVPHMMTEIVFTSLLLLYLLLCTGRDPSLAMSIAAGIVLGAGTLVRPTILLLPAVVFAVRWMGSWTPGENFRALAITGGTALLILSPWLARNLATFGRVALSTNTGVNFWIGAHSGAGGSYSFPPGNPLMVSTDEFDQSDIGFRLGLEFIRDHPFCYAEIVAKKWAHFFSVDYWLLVSMHYRPEFRSAPKTGVFFSTFPLTEVLALHLPFVAVLLLATFGLCFRTEGDWSSLVALLAPCAYWILVHLVFFGDARFRFPVVPLMMIGASYGVDILLRNTYVRTRLRTAVFCFYVLLFASGWIAERIIMQREADTYGGTADRTGQSTLRALTPKSTLSFTQLKKSCCSSTGFPCA